MRKILIFEPYLSGHRLEYIHHLHEEAAKTPGNHYYFAVSNQFLTLKDHFEWSEAGHITFLYMDQRFVASSQHKGKVKRIFSLVSLASEFAKKHNADDIFFISMAEYMPWLPLFFRAKTSISGIMYYIYLYEWKSKGLISRIRDALTMLLVIPVRKYKHVFLLNDMAAAIYLNKKFNTGKFQYLPDPYMPFSGNKENNGELRKRLDIRDTQKIYLHFGSMSFRKGTLNILQAIALLPEKDIQNRCFIFAGKVNDDIKESFYALTESLKERVSIYIFDRFCEPSFLSSLCEACSVILAPYYNTAYSSGIIGYAANYRKPIVVPDRGLIGKLVRRYRLGYLLEDNSPREIARFISDTGTFLSIDGTRYTNTHFVNHFVRETLLFE